jgi:ABC-type nitrate/sulfonate/bicarbonate transport system substrate-binding protein
MIFILCRKIFPLLLTVICLALLACSGQKEERKFRIGHNGGNLMGALYAAGDFKDWPKTFSTRKFGADADIAYALLNHDLDAGFIAIEKLKDFEKLAGFERLSAFGRVSYPYGATLVLRKGLNKRLQELDGLKIAVSSPNCVMLKAFVNDAARLGADISGLKYEVIPFSAMLPALESGAVDGAIIKGVYSVIALQQGHSILYQNWDVTPGDECCPAIVDQSILVLLADKERRAEAEQLRGLLLKAQEQGQTALRQAIADKTTIPFATLEAQPAAEFVTADDALLKLFTRFARDTGGDDDDDSDKNDDGKDDDKDNSGGKDKNAAL